MDRRRKKRESKAKREKTLQKPAPDEERNGNEGMKFESLIPPPSDMER